MQMQYWFITGGQGLYKVMASEVVRSCRMQGLQAWPKDFFKREGRKIKGVISDH